MPRDPSLYSISIVIVVSFELRNIALAKGKYFEMEEAYKGRCILIYIYIFLFNVVCNL